MSAELQLVALAALLWLSDSILLLCADEVVLSCGPRSAWQVSTARSGFVIRGRQLCLLNPLTFYRPSVRLRWNVYAVPADAAAPTAWSGELQKLSVAAPWTVTAGAGLLVLLPVGLFTSLGAGAILAAAFLVYGSVAASLWLIRRRCSVPALGKLQFAGFAFECLACPPFGVNTVRRAGLRVQVSEPLEQAAVRLLSPAQQETLRDHCLGVLDEELQRCEDPSPARQALLRRRSALENWLPAA